MPTLFNLLSLPSALLLLTISPSLAAVETQWPHNLPKHMKYFPEDEVHVKRGLQIQERLAWETPVGVKKMSTDEGEMFMFDNWIFQGDQEAKELLGRAGPDHASQHKQPDELGDQSANISTLIQPLSPLRPHSEQTGLRDSYARFAIRSLLMNRGFKCPEGTNNCSSINQPDSCCSTSDECITIPDNGYGPVGCCPQGQNCVGAISCDTAQGYTSCPDSPNGGCCLPGYSCQDVGCIAVATSTAIVLPSSSSTVSSPASSVIPSSSSSAVISSAASSKSTAIVVVPTSLSSSSTYTCSSGWFTCAASLGGGCCQNGRQCGSGIICSGTDSATRTSSSMVPSAPVRPTSNSGSDVTTTTITGPSVCPTGFYVCSAYYPSGCCRVGMDCHTTGSCIQTASVSVIVSDGITIVAPTGASVATTARGQGGSCPSGWYSCAANLGGNCCLK
ncbi:uncharacterized protein BDZ99DRAFT_35198 [Mytilinidion resinicola]|uniref:GPI anchored protein n=1 Tax=Mytilinidion resinicola TaxID=574789 RepID=A0A6A6YME8_9PEZI|nr:uncharacterized protein BDZ99DRAFT_35198 [Mytilinidion resinicola]KAF2809718.1 hypothetical protein BDZ99DRAFT_35198 [Mytilinidion resinicola]